MLDFDVQRCTRRCAATEVPLEPGDAYYSVLLAEGADVVRRDFAKSAWQGPPEGALGWWAAQVPADENAKPKLAPSEVALELFDRWRDQPEHADATYVLALLLVRKRVFRFSDSPFTEQASPEEQLQLFCPTRAAEYEVPVVEVTPQRADEIQQRLIELLYDNQ
ncbi:hypothetical protein [Aeoliella mucimassa]|uniref:Uncharacterized protein n=1 Tax=Aeoliella mucimassa TaxID=2527972 RepID=A0A518AL25_9BACT|nr:hypothetical protein [Aeoliella mucimassa]QDU55427.1 hypothetical protein Pan181_16160 [Aeoliella mucimassa]